MARTRLLGVQALGRRRARAGRAWAAQGRAGLGSWARAGRHDRRAWALGVARRQACVGARVGGSSTRAQRARGRARHARRGALGVGARGAGRGRAGRAAWAAGLALGSALGALGPFSIRFDLFFSESPNEHRSL